ncbi:MAG: hypothetical protein ABIB65_01140, partial [Candidatus Margulisiibacteriota bacterium]
MTVPVRAQFSTRFSQVQKSGAALLLCEGRKAISNKYCALATDQGWWYPNADSLGAMLSSDRTKFWMVLADGVGSCGHPCMASAWAVVSALFHLNTGRGIADLPRLINTEFAQFSGLDLASTFVAVEVDNASRILSVCSVGDSGVLAIPFRGDPFLLAHHHSRSWEMAKMGGLDISVPISFQRLNNIKAYKRAGRPDPLVSYLGMPPEHFKHANLYSLRMLADRDVPARLLIYSDGAVDFAPPDGVSTGEDYLVNTAKEALTPEQIALTIVDNALTGAMRNGFFGILDSAAQKIGFQGLQSLCHEIP